MDTLQPLAMQRPSCWPRRGPQQAARPGEWEGGGTLEGLEEHFIALGFLFHDSGWGGVFTGARSLLWIGCCWEAGVILRFDVLMCFIWSIIGTTQG